MLVRFNTSRHMYCSFAGFPVIGPFVGRVAERTPDTVLTTAG